MRSLLYSIVIILSLIVSVRHVSAAPVPPLVVRAPALAVYGWKDGVMTELASKRQHYLHPIASIVKLVTAKVAQELYTKDAIFTISPKAVSVSGSIKGIVPGAQFTRDDLLTALLVQSSNDSAMALMEPVGSTTFLAHMNDFIHRNRYTMTSFINPSGLDPAKGSKLAPNRMTPYHLSRLLSDIYEHDPLMTRIMGQSKAYITDQKTGAQLEIRTSNGLYFFDDYKDKVLIGKTGLTNSAKESIAFITPGTASYDYITVVILGSTDRVRDAMAVLDWIKRTQ